MVHCSTCFKRLIKSFDGFGTFITFRINNDKEYKSLIGGLCTLIFSLFAITYTIYCSIIFFSKQNVEFIFTNKILEKDPFINLTNSKFNLAFGVQYLTTAMPAIENTSKYFTYQMNIIEWVGDDEIQTYPINLSKCTYDDFYNLVNQTFDINDLGNMICPQLDNYLQYNFTLNGLYTDFYFKFIELEIRLSDYALQHINETKMIMNESPLEMAMFYLDTAIDYENTKDATPTYINYQYRALDYDFIKSTELFISYLEFNNDENLLVEKPSLFSDAMTDHSFDSFRYIPERGEESLIGKITIKASPKVIQVKRKYQKFPSFIADVSSLLEEMLFLMLIVINYIERKAVDNKLIRKMLKYRGSKYYDIDYLVHTFSQEAKNKKINEIIEKQKLCIERQNNITTNRKSVFVLLRDRKREMTIKHSNDIQYSTYTVFNKGLHLNLFEEQKISNHHVREESNDINSLSSENQEENESKIKGEFNHSNRSNNMYSQSNKESLRYHNHQLSTHSMKSEGDSNNASSESKELEVSKFKRIKETKITRTQPHAEMNLCSSLFVTFCFCCSTKIENKKKMFIKAENKIHYYLDIYTYIKKMQEIDLLKYCLFDENQSTLFTFLSTPPVQLGTGPSGLYREFTESQISYKKLDKSDIDSIYSAYKNIRERTNLSFEDLKLLRLVNAEIKFLT